MYSLLILNASRGLDSMPDDTILVSRPGDQGLGLGLEFFSKVLITSLDLIPYHTLQIVFFLDNTIRTAES